MATQKDIQNLAWTMLGEAHPGDQEGMTAVGNTVLNRLAAGNYGSSITAVVMADNQYAAWGIGDQAVNQNGHMVTKYPVGSPQYQAAYDLANSMVNGEVQDNTGGAVNYRAASAGTKWAGGKPTVNIGGNVYQVNHPISAGTQLVAQEPNASSLDAYNSAYGWSDLSDADPATGAPVVADSTPSPGDAIAAINDELGPGALTSAQGAPDVSTYAPQPDSAPVPLAPLPAGQAPQQDSSPPIPMDRSDVAPSQSQVAQTALNSAKAWLAGSNVDLSKVPASQQAALVAAIPTIASLAGDPKSELNYLQQSGLYSALIAAVPSHAPNFAESAWASMNGVALPARLPNDIKDWNLPTGSDVNAAVATIGNFLSDAQNQRVVNFAPDTGSTLGTVAPNNGGWSSYLAPPAQAPVAPPPAPNSNFFTNVNGQSIPSYQLDQSSPYGAGGPTTSVADAPNGGWDAYTNPTGEGNTSAYWTGAQQGAPDVSGNGGWDQLVGGGGSPSQTDMGASNGGWNDYVPPSAGAINALVDPNYQPGADLSSLNVAPSVQVPQYITISKQVQVPADQPIETGSGVHWDAAQGAYVLGAPAKAAPAMVTKTIQQQVPNPAYKAPAQVAAPAAPVAPQPIAVSNGYNYLQNASGGYTNVGQTNPSISPSAAYAQAAAAALSSQTNLGGGGGNHDSQNRAGGGLTG